MLNVIDNGTSLNLASAKSLTKDTEQMPCLCTYLMMRSHIRDVDNLCELISNDDSLFEHGWSLFEVEY